MAETTTVARPYAKAAFEYAREQQGGLKHWSEMLAAAAAIAENPSMRGLLTHPDIDNEQRTDLFLSLLDRVGGEFPPAGRNFIKVLAENRRLTVLPEVARLFEALREEEEKTVHAEAISAQPLSSEQQRKIAEALKQRLGRDVELDCRVDESLLGGVVIRAGDMVIDGSARGRLAKLATALRQ